MPRTIKFLLDENLPSELKKDLKKHNFYVEHINDKLKGSPDDKVFEYAIKNRMCIITKDYDFHSFKKNHHFGILKINGIQIDPITNILKVLNKYDDLEDLFIEINLDKFVLQEKRFTKRGRFKQFYKRAIQYLF